MPGAQSPAMDDPDLVVRGRREDGGSCEPNRVRPNRRCAGHAAIRARGWRRSAPAFRRLDGFPGNVVRRARDSVRGVGRPFSERRRGYRAEIRGARSSPASARQARAPRSQAMWLPRSCSVSPSDPNCAGNALDACSHTSSTGAGPAPSSSATPSGSSDAPAPRSGAGCPARERPSGIGRSGCIGECGGDQPACGRRTPRRRRAGFQLRASPSGQTIIRPSRCPCLAEYECSSRHTPLHSGATDVLRFRANREMNEAVPKTCDHWTALEVGQPARVRGPPTTSAARPPPNSLGRLTAGVPDVRLDADTRAAVRSAPVNLSGPSNASEARILAGDRMSRAMLQD